LTADEVRGGVAMGAKAVAEAASARVQTALYMV